MIRLAKTMEEMAGSHRRLQESTATLAEGMTLLT